MEDKETGEGVTVQSVAGKITAYAHFSKSGKLIREEETPPRTIQARYFATTPASVSASVGLTHNLGNYESVKVGVTVTLPCYSEEITPAIIEARGIAEDAVAEMSEFSEAFGQFKKQWRKTNG